MNETIATILLMSKFDIILMVLPARVDMVVDYEIRCQQDCGILLENRSRKHEIDIITLRVILTPYEMS